LHLREGNTIYLHGSPANEVMKAIVRDGEAFVTVTVFDGLRLARSGFESSIAYRSVVVVGGAREVTDEVEKSRVLNRFVDRVVAGRASEVRPMSDQEQRLTMLVAVSMDEASAKVSAGPTDDDADDQMLPIWSGTVPAQLVFGRPVPDTNGAMAGSNLEVPASVRALLGDA
jgi:nitroimidazol reductase NimA-like FMN-containing flavoprotein (pyridoxamine 5'-phosphate oxidase superfamily)